MAKLLIIDDEPDLCAIFQRIFQDEGHSVATAATGQEGIAKSRADQPDLIFLDLKMPSMDGITCLKRLRLVSKVSKIVVLTGYGTLKTAKEAMRLGAYDYTAKPFDLDLIRELIQEVALGAER
ncbi:MAG: response regulator [Candidatus Omnitrophica bacterium]|nr:response regulator [Candidatus Omnitrophota bacterium]